MSAGDRDRPCQHKPEPPPDKSWLKTETLRDACLSDLALAWVVAGCVALAVAGVVAWVGWGR